MKKRILLVVTIVLLCTSGYAQHVLWNKHDGKNIKQSDLLNRASVPSEYQLFSLNLEVLKLQLKHAPLRESKISKVIVQFPDGNGELKKFRIYEAPVMEAGLAEKYPDMKSYAGQGVDNPSETIRFSITSYGLHNMMLSSKGASYTDPYTKDKNIYIVYKKADLSAPRDFKCGVADTKTRKNKNGGVTTLSEPATDGVMRHYRLAMACTVEYAAFHITEAEMDGGTMEQQTEAVLAAMNVTVTRVNSIYERDFSITFKLVANNDALIFIDSDGFDNENTENILLEQSQLTIDEIIGFDNYDIGHTVSTGGGGVAQMYSPCSEYKAMGITGLWAPVGDAYDIDFVAHEMGHQFGGSHTFNNDCDGNVMEDASYETGSGSTIMAYAGVCFPSVQDHSDTCFHKKSIQEITDFMKGWGDCSENIATNNATPIANAGLDYTIPKSTPFILKGTATDADSDSMTYSWEQMDKEISIQPPVADAIKGPNFRSLLPKETPERYMPRLEDVIANNLVPTWEVISDVARTFNFVFTVRDNNVLGGQVAYDDMQVNISGTAGPFLVLSPNTNLSWEANSTQTVTWDVAGTTGNGVNAEFVDVLFSSDGGLTYPVVLATHVANDGSETITVPSTPGTTNRIMVKGNDHIFYDISNTDFTITPPPATMTIAIVGSPDRTECKGEEAVYNLSYETLGGFTGTTTFSVTGNPAGSTVTFSPESISANGNVIVTVVTTTTNVAGEYPIVVTATAGAITKAVTLNLTVVDNDFGIVQLTLPANNAMQVQNNVQFTWSQAPNATGYQIEIATDDTFDTILIDELVATNSYSAALENDTTYFWRVLPTNEICTGIYSEVFQFTRGDIAGINDTVFSNFSLYPNPNKGSFTVKFNSATGNEIQMGVYDMRGRQLLNKLIANVGTIDEAVSIGAVETGVYLVNIRDGESVITKKIIIE
ncbi:Ser-Thr-rich glycosyl-phosphatidyl-inositol-anchored membrane family protein [compost metagenome]